MGKGQKLYIKAKKIIPGGTQLLSKRPELFLPNLWPAYYKKAKGCEIWDLDNKKYIDMSYMGIGANILGYSDPEVNAAVKKAVDGGNSSTLNCPEEIDLAETLCKLHPWANMVRFARSGGEAMVIAVRIARAYSGKDKILFCGYHGWHDWYLASNLADNKSLDGHLIPGLDPKGVPRALKGSSIPFEYNDTETFINLIKKHKNELGAVVMEPLRNFYPKKGFLETIRELTKKYKIPLVLDEVSSGFRLNPGGAHLVLGIEPDIAVFSKSLGNGFPIAAIIGRKDIMSSAQTSFISSTNWTERVGPVSALAMIKKYKRERVHIHLSKIGKKIQEGWQKLAKRNNLEIEISGIYPLSHFEFKYPEKQALKTLFTQMMLEQGFLATNALYASFAHKDIHVNKYIKAVDKTFSKIKDAMEKNNIQNSLRSEVSHTGFRRLA
jgi:glutamate-1-semialdehyde 2,1-aminomutase